MNNERVFLSAVGVAQGLCIWYLLEQSPATQPATAINASLLAFVAFGGAVLHFTWTGRDVVRLLVLAGISGLIFGAVTCWVSLMVPLEFANSVPTGDQARSVTWIPASMIAIYIAVPFLQIFQRSGRAVFPYVQLFQHSWNNFHIGLVGGLFLLSLWVVLWFWGTLFNLIDIDFFAELFSKNWFGWPISGGALGFGVAMGREREKIIATLKSLTLSVFRALLPLTSFVALLFLVTLPFTGLEPLWDTGRASYILLAWIALTVLFVNAVYMDGDIEPPFALPVRRMVEAGVFIMIVYAAIALYGLGLRVDQHGLSVSRFVGLLVAIVLGLYALGYAVSVIWRGAHWMSGIAKVNRPMALLVLVLAILMHTPVLDPLTWSAWNQFNRLSEGTVSVEEFDFGYLLFELGQRGEDRLVELESLENHPRAGAIRAAVGEVRGALHRFAWDNRQALGHAMDDIELHAALSEWPPGLFDGIKLGVGNSLLAQCGRERNCLLFPLDFPDHDGDEYGLLTGGRYFTIYLFGRGEADDWMMIGDLSPIVHDPRLERDAVIKAIEALDIAIKLPIWPLIQIGAAEYFVDPR
ncbi:MAG: DUF4153 domain-containing protein [Pseudomonadales bacterium]